MNIKKEIGNRIATARKALDLTVKELAAKTKSLKVARIGNWEQGIRTPGPSEILQLAAVLKADPAYLMCLTNVEYSERSEHKLVPVFPLHEAARFEKYFSKPLPETIKNFEHIVIKNPNNSSLFAIRIADESMTTEFKNGDTVIINTQKKVTPGSYVLVQLKEQDKALLRKYRLINNANPKKPTFELIPLNSDWPTLTIKSSENCKILGVCVEQRRYRE